MEVNLENLYVDVGLKTVSTYKLLDSPSNSLVFSCKTMEQLKCQIKSKMKAMHFAPLQFYFLTMMHQICYALRTITNESYRLIMSLKKKQSLFSPEHTNLQVTHKLK